MNEDWRSAFFSLSVPPDPEPSKRVWFHNNTGEKCFLAVVFNIPICIVRWQQGELHYVRQRHFRRQGKQ